MPDVALVPDKPETPPIERRVALVIGNGNYKSAPELKNPAYDAQAVASTLRELDFDVVEGVDLSALGMDEKIAEFAEKINGAHAALLFFAGHGLQVNGENYLVPVDAVLANEGQLQRQTIRLQDQLNMMGGRARVSIVILDCCRDNPFTRSMVRSFSNSTRGFVSRGLAEVRPDRGALVAFATGPGSVAKDGAGAHSPFTEALLACMKTPGQSLTDILTDVTNLVAEATEQTQIPWYNASLQKRFYFKRPPLMDSPVEPKPDDTAKPEKDKKTDAPLPEIVVGTPSPNPPIGKKSDNGEVSGERSTGGQGNSGEVIADPPSKSWISLAAAFVGVVILGYFLVTSLHAPRPDNPTKIDNGPSSAALAQQLSSPDRALADRVAVYFAGRATNADKQSLLSKIVKSLQSQLIYVDANATIPSNCRAPTEKGPSSTPQLPLLCAGLDAKTQVQMVAVMATVPKTVWQDPAFKAQRDLALVVVADIDAQRRLQTEQFLPESTSDLVSLKATLGLGDRPKNLVTLQFNGNFLRGNAQAIMDRLVSLGWNLQGVQRSSNRSNEIRYGSNPAQPPIAEQLSQDLSIQRLTVAANFNPSLANSQQLDIYLTNPLPAWGSSMPSSGWCYQEYDSAKADAERYLVACHATQPACLTVRGNAPQKKQSDCILIDALDKTGLTFSGGGYANSWYVNSSQKVGSPFPALPL